jgi:hypothetical protein
MATVRHRNRQRVGVKIAMTGLACVWMLVSGPQVVCAGKAAEYDIGYIESVQDGIIRIQGSQGLHVLEALRVCRWCEQGLEVTVTFKGYARVILRPASRFHHGKPLEALLVRDGRQRN